MNTLLSTSRFPAALLACYRVEFCPPFLPRPPWPTAAAAAPASSPTASVEPAASPAASVAPTTSPVTSAASPAAPAASPAAPAASRVNRGKHLNAIASNAITSKSCQGIVTA